MEAMNEMDAFDCWVRALQGTHMNFPVSKLISDILNFISVFESNKT